MSTEVVTGIRLLRAVMVAQREADKSAFNSSDPNKGVALLALRQAKADLDAFIAGSEADYKVKQTGEKL